MLVCVGVCLLEGNQFCIIMSKAQGYNLMHPKCLQLCLSEWVCASMEMHVDTCACFACISVCVHTHGTMYAKRSSLMIMYVIIVWY